MSISPNHRSFLRDRAAPHDGAEVLVERFQMAVSAKHVTAEAFGSAQAAFRHLLDHCRGEARHRDTLAAARRSMQEMRTRRYQGVADEQAANRAVKLRIVTAIDAAAKVPNPLVFSEQVTGCRLLWKQTGSAGPDNATLVAAYREADALFREVCRARVARSDETSGADDGGRDRKRA